MEDPFNNKAHSGRNKRRCKLIQDNPLSNKERGRGNSLQFWFVCFIGRKEIKKRKYSVMLVSVHRY